MIIGVISDTHGLLRPEAVQKLQDSELILHGGDIGDPNILKQLAEIAPVHAVRGNNDRDRWADSIPITLDLRILKYRIHVIHNLDEMKADPKQYSIVVSGHSHRPVIQKKEATLFINPGSAGPRRFHLPIAIAKLLLKDTSVSARIIELRVDVPGSENRNRR